VLVGFLLGIIFKKEFAGMSVSDAGVFLSAWPKAKIY
jgi:hypothetical protein